VVYVGTADGIEAELAGRAGVPFQAIESGQLRGMAPQIALRNVLKMGRGVRQTSQLLAAFRPNVTFVTGGFVAAPVVWASWRAGVPVLIYLPDIEPGLAIRWLSRLADKVAVTFPEVAAHFPGKTVVTGYPVRPEILTAAGRPGEARRQLGLAQDEPVLLVFGGSRGSRSINQALAAALPELLLRCQVVHISGNLDWPQAQERAQALPAELRPRYHLSAYLHDAGMAQALAAADLVIARAGASTLGEFPALGLPSILAPYPYSGQHQDANADYLASRGAALKIADAELPARLLPAVVSLLGNPTALQAMAGAARSLAQPAAAANIAQELLRLSSG
jgi:UDP-N-acetylglucosamine--N-acetylmuramyl-(pentapeptide) pyrophosphoryl-undecaprenol N-acetylglucosamine transferase